MCVGTEPHRDTVQLAHLWQDAKDVTVGKYCEILMCLF